MNKQQQIEKMKNKQTQNNVFDILDKFEFFQGQKAGRELWNDKPKEVQDKDIADFIKDINYIRSYLQDSVMLSREEYDTLKAENDKYVKDCIDYIATINKLENKVWEVEQQASKETAEKIFKMLISKLDSNQFLSGKRIIMEVDVKNLAKQFDVEIKE